MRRDLGDKHNDEFELPRDATLLYEHLLHFTIDERNMIITDTDITDDAYALWTLPSHYIANDVNEMILHHMVAIMNTLTVHLSAAIVNHSSGTGTWSTNSIMVTTVIIIIGVMVLVLVLIMVLLMVSLLSFD